VTLWTGWLPLGADATAFALLWAPAMALRALAGTALCRGYLRAREAYHAELTSARAHLRALCAVLRPAPAASRVPRHDDVDPTRGADDELDRGGLAALRQQRLPVMLAGALAVGLLGRGLHALDLVPMPHLPGFAAWLVPGLAAIELRRVCRSLLLHARRRQLRTSFRFPVRATAKVGAAFWDGSAGALGVVTDINPAGATVSLARNLPLNSQLRLTFFLPDALGNAHRIDVGAEVRSCRTADDGFRLGTHFINLEPAAHQAIVEYCYVVSTFERVRTDYVDVLIPAPRRARLHAAHPQESAA
jgi:hypothetical protein